MGLSPPVAPACQPPGEPFGFRCATCGVGYEGMPLHFGGATPDLGVPRDAGGRTTTTRSGTSPAPPPRVVVFTTRATLASMATSYPRCSCHALGAAPEGYFAQTGALDKLACRTTDQ